MKLIEQFTEAVYLHPSEAHSHFVVVDADNWSVFPSGTCDKDKMEKAGWVGPFSYKVNDVPYEAFGKSSAISDSMKLFLDDWGVSSSAASLIVCPSCGETLEIPPSVDGQHFRCSTCNNKFVLFAGKAIASTEHTKGKGNAKCGDEANDETQKQAAFFLLEKIRNSKDLLKYVRLFAIAPMSIKVATIFVLLQVGIDILFRADFPGVSTTYAYGFVIVTLWLLSGVLKGYNRSRWVLVGVRVFALLMVPFLCLGHSGSLKSTYLDFAQQCMTTFISSIPYLVALLMPSANLWFNGCVEDMRKLKQAAENDMAPLTLGEKVITVVIIALVMLGIAIGKVLVSDVAEEKNGSVSCHRKEGHANDVIKREMKIIDQRVAQQQSILKASKLDLVFKEEDGRYPYLNAEKEPQNIWNALTTYIKEMEKELEWIESYSPSEKFDASSDYQKYVQWVEYRRTWLEKLYAMHHADVEFVKSVREYFGVNYGLSSSSSIEMKKIIAKAIGPVGVDGEKQMNKIDAMRVRAVDAENSYNDFIKKRNEDLRVVLLGS